MGRAVGQLASYFDFFPCCSLELEKFVNIDFMFIPLFFFPKYTSVLCIATTEGFKSAFLGSVPLVPVDLA